MNAVALLLAVLLLAGGCATMGPHAGDWYIKPDMTQHEKDWTECVEFGRSYDTKAALWGGLGGIPGAFIGGATMDPKQSSMFCMFDRGYKYTPLGPDGKPWRP
jgi:hypothetical protein